MRHATVLTEHLPYSLSMTPVSATVAKGVTVTLTFTGTLTPPDFQNARPGDFADLVIVSITP